MARLLASGVTCVVASASPAIEPQEEYAIKAAYLVNFARLVAWPEGRGPLADGRVTLCVRAGPEAMLAITEGVVGATVDGLGVATRSVGTPEELTGCHLLYVAAEPEQEAAALLERSVAQATLTVGEGEAFVRKGGMIGLVRLDNKLRFAIDRGEATRAGLRISSRLLRLSTWVDE